MRLLVLLVCGFVAVGFAGSAHAGVNLLCSAGSDPTTNSDTSTQTLKLSDVHITISGVAVAATDCFGEYSANPLGATAITTAINSAFDAEAFGVFNYLASTSSASNFPTLTSPLGGGIKFTITVPTAGTWNVTWQDTNTAQAPNLPIAVNLALDLRGSDEDAAYYFQDLVLPASGGGTGTFTVDFLGSNGTTLANIGPGAGVLTLEGMLVPEPSSAAVLASALAGLRYLRRRRRRA